MRIFLVTVLLGVALVTPSAAQDSPYFVTYDHHMEEPSDLEVSLTPVFGAPREGNASLATQIELEYGTRAWWTTALYFDGQSTFGDGAVFTGYRIENRVRLLMHEYAINPVLYVEFADVNGADKAVREVVGFDSWHDLAIPNGEARGEKKREVETKLILSSNRHGWNFAGNAIAEKNLSDSPWEFGYAIGASRPLALAASPNECRVCRENFSAGIELYGGLGERGQVTLTNTSHYVAPTASWSLPKGITFRVSPALGLTRMSNRAFVRFGISYEIRGLR
jgi:hypothetical protein